MEDIACDVERRTDKQAAKWYIYFLIILDE